MSNNEIFFTDVVKDVIGNDPVIDQFDTYYEASFFGTMQDDYITGSMLAVTDAKNKQFSVSTGGLGTRGRAFSIYYAESEPPLESTYGSAGVALNPFLSKRVVPWRERSSSTAYRLRQSFDGSERYYDSCIPNVAYCLNVDGSRVWTNTDIASNDRSRTTLAPYASVVTGSAVGYMLFNAVKQDRSAEGYEEDPTTNNRWTWSFPYENRYRPTDRLVKFNSNLDLKSNLSARLPIYDKKEREFIGSNLLNQEFKDKGSPDKSSFTYRDSNDATMDCTPVNLSKSALKNINFFMPLLPGYHNEAERNSLRIKTTITGSLGDGKIRPSWYRLSDTDVNYGHSLLVPGDVNFSKYADNQFLNGYQNASTPALMPVTQSLNVEDQIKFLFGFGDNNTITYGKRSFDSSRSTLAYSLDLDSYSAGTHPHQFSSYNNDGLTVNWNWNPDNLSNANYRKKWYVAIGSTVDKEYYWISGSAAAGKGIFWKVSGSNSHVLLSNTTEDYGGSMSNTGSDASPFIVDITSSYPWNFSYDRAIAGLRTQSDLVCYFAAFPGQPSDWLNKVSFSVNTSNPPIPGLQQVLASYFDYISGSTIDTGGPSVNSLATMQTYNFMRDYYYSEDLSDSDLLNLNQPGINSSLGEYLLEPGEYRLVFLYKFLALGLADPQTAALRDFKIYTYKEDAFPVVENSRIGGNNYPRFKTVTLDKSINPVVSGGIESFKYGYFLNDIPSYSDYIVSGSADTSKSIIFGISPEIRGWKYGLASGFPTHSKAVFRRDKYGQFRDMLEQRPYTKFINVFSSPLDNDAITVGNFNSQVDSRVTAYAEGFTDIGPSVVTVNFVKQRYRKNDKGVGYIYNEKVDPSQTYSQNLSHEVTSSLPYFDNTPRHRSEGDLAQINSANITSLQFDSTGLTVT